MSIPRLAIERPITMFMLSAVVILIGGMSLVRLPVDLMPDVSFPSITVRVTYAGVGPLEMEELEKRITAGVCIALGLPFAVASILPLLFEPRPWLWVYGIVLLATGFTSCCFWPICIPLLVFWIKPDVQRYFGKDA